MLALLRADALTQRCGAHRYAPASVASPVLSQERAAAHAVSSCRFQHTALTPHQFFFHSLNLATRVMSQMPEGKRARAREARVARTRDARAALKAAAEGGELPKKWPFFGDARLMRTALRLAYENDHPEAVRYFLEGGAAEALDPRDAAFLATAVKDLGKLLMQAARCGSNNAVRALLALGAPVDVTDVHGHTPLMEAAKFGRASTVELLAATGADVNRAMTNRDNGAYGHTAAFFAARNGDAGTVRALLEVGAVFNSACASVAVDKGNVAVVGLLPLERLSLRDQMVFAVHQGDVCEVRRLLLEPGAMNTFEKGRTNFACAAALGDVHIVQAFLEAKAQVDGYTGPGCGGPTPIFCAATNGHVPVVQLLLDAKATANFAPAHRQRQFAAEVSSKGHAAVVELLVAAKASL